MGKASTDATLRKQLITLVQCGDAHLRFDDVVTNFPVNRAGLRPHGSPHSAWELLEHLRIAQADILLFSQGQGYVELKWPDDYWPESPAPKNQREWDGSLKSVRRDIKRFIELLSDKKRDLFEPFPWGTGQTLLREALLIADHNSYHLGQLMLVRRMIE